MEGTTTLADSLLDDLDDLSDVEEEIEEEEQQQQQKPTTTTEKEEENESKNESEQASSDSQGDTINHHRKRRLLDDVNLLSHLELIRKMNNQKTSSSSVTTTTHDGDDNNNNIDDEVDDQQEQNHHQHELIVQCNKYILNLTNELINEHHNLCDLYKKKFPELEELIIDPTQYTKAIRVIWNEMDVTKVTDQLKQFLSSNQIITITVSASTTSGQELTENELIAIDKSCTYIEKLIQIQNEFISYIESCMESLVPSVCVLIGPSLAARIIGLTGGLPELSKIPSCNLQVIGQMKQNATSRGGFSSASSAGGNKQQGGPHQGIVLECDLIQKHCPPYLQKKALKVVSSKLALAIRYDYINVTSGRQRSSSAGIKFRQEIIAKINKWDEPDKAQVIKALPNRSFFLRDIKNYVLYHTTSS